MSDLVAFLIARLDEDEAAARKSIEVVGREPWQADHWDEMHPADAAHFERWLPARVLREVDAKRRIVEDYRISAAACRRVTGSALDSPGYRSMRGGRDAFRSACVSLAAAYSDHPDYPEAAAGKDGGQ